MWKFLAQIMWDCLSKVYAVYYSISIKQHTNYINWCDMKILDDENIRWNVNVINKTQVFAIESKNFERWRLNKMNH